MASLDPSRVALRYAFRTQPGHTQVRLNKAVKELENSVRYLRPVVLQLAVEDPESAEEVVADIYEAAERFRGWTGRFE